MKRDYLYGTQYTILQPDGQYHFSSDTELLGRFMDIRHSDDVLEIGCACGALLLYAASYQPRHLTGIDLFESTVEVCRLNLEYNKVSADLFCTDVKDFRSRQYSAIICNPPYFRTENRELINEDPILAAARHEQYLTADDLFSSVRRLLKDNGRFFMVHRASRMNELLHTARTYGMICTRVQFAYESQNKNAKSAAMEFRFSSNAEMKVLPPVYLDQMHTEGENR